MIFSKENVFTVDMDKIAPIQLGGPQVGTKETVVLKRLVSDPAGTCSLEDFPAGTECNWAFWHDEVHLVISGSAEITYTLPPSHNNMRKQTTKKGDTYLILNGTRATFKVTSKEPYRHYCVIMPRYRYEKWLLEDAARVQF